MVTHEACHMTRVREGLDDHEAHDPRAGKRCKSILNTMPDPGGIVVEC